VASKPRRGRLSVAVPVEKGGGVIEMEIGGHSPWPTSKKGPEAVVVNSVMPLSQNVRSVLSR